MSEYEIRHFQMDQERKFDRTINYVNYKSLESELAQAKAELTQAREELAKFKVESQKEIDELSEPMSCNHMQAEMQPSDEGPDICVACYLQREIEDDRAYWKSLAEKAREALKKIYEGTTESDILTAKEALAAFEKEKP